MMLLTSRTQSVLSRHRWRRIPGGHVSWLDNKTVATLAKSFAPRFRNRAPAKNLDRLAMMVIWTVRPYTDKAGACQ